MTKKSDEADAAEELATSNEDADKEAATKGYLFDIQLSYFTKFTKDELLEQGYSKEDVARAAKVLKFANLALPKESVPRAEPAVKEEEEETGG